MIKNLSIVGAGKLGAPMGAALASKGFNVLLCDVDQAKVDAINNGQSPVSETDLPDLIAANKDRLRATTNIGESVRFADITFVVTATPSAPDGKFSLEHVLPVCKEIGRALRTKSKQAFHVVVITSTVMPGDTWSPIRETLEHYSEKKAGESFGLAYNPEFIALGSVISDFLHPDFVLLGASDPLTEARLSSVYKSISDAPIASMNIPCAELTKISINSYITMKISFANMLSRICNDLPGSDVDVVTRAMGMDSRIGGKYLKGGVSYGGPCFPRDNRALATLGQSLPLVIDSFNRAQITWLADVVRKTDKGSTLILGRSYKTGTDVETESPALELQRDLLYLETNKIYWASDSDVIGAVLKFDTIVVMLPDPKYRDLDFTGKTVIDPWRFLPELASDETVRYIPLGIGPCAQ